MHAVQAFSAGIKFEPNLVKIGQLVQTFKHRETCQISYLIFFTRKGSRIKTDRTLGSRVFVQTCLSPPAMTPHSTAVPVPGYTCYSGNVCRVQQVARIRGLVHGLALQRKHEFLHLGTTLMHSCENEVRAADRIALNESTVNYH